MSEKIYEIGYDTSGRRIVLDESGKYVTHIPCNLSETEVLTRLQGGMAVNFDARNQGMQNIPAAQVDESIEVGVAPREKWPLFYAWHIKWSESWKSDDERNFDEYREAYLSKGLSPEQEWQIIIAWTNHMAANPRDERTFDEFRETYCAIPYQGDMIVGKKISKSIPYKYY